WTRCYVGCIRGVAPRQQRGDSNAVLVMAAAIALVALLAMTGVLKLDPVGMAAGASWVMLALGVGYFAYLLFFAGLTAVERKRVLVMVALVAASVTFWAGYEQTGASMNLFADRYTDRH